MVDAREMENIEDQNVETAPVVTSGSSAAEKTANGVKNGKPEKRKIYLDLEKVSEEFKANGLKAVTMQIAHSVEDLHGVPSKTSKSFSPLFVYQFLEEPYDKSELEAVADTVKDQEMVGDESGDEEEDEMAEESDDDEEAVNPVQVRAVGDGQPVPETPDETEGLIVGYKDLQIKVFFTPASLRPYLLITYSEALPVEERSVPDLLTSVESFYGHKTVSSEHQFTAFLEEDRKFKPVGMKLRNFRLTAKDSSQHSLELYEVGKDAIEVGYPGRFTEYLSNIQPFLAWFIYASSVLDTDDPKWLHYFLFDNCGEVGFRLVGYCSVYRYPVLAKKETGADQIWMGEFSTRARIAQFLVLPPYQKMGYGSKLLRAVIERLREDSKTLDISVEDPDEAFTRLFNAVVSRLVKDHISSRNMTVDFNRSIDPQLLKTLHKDLKLPSSVLLIAYDVLACCAARTAGPEALKKFYDQLTSRQRRSIKAQESMLGRKLQRIKFGYYIFNGETKKEKEKRYQLWTANCLSAIQSTQGKMQPEQIKSANHARALIIQHAAKRMDELEF